MQDDNALELARGIEKELSDLRRDIHRHPELAFEEVRTGALVADYCEKLGLKVTRGAAKTGVIAVLNADRPGHALAFRADMDALPIREEGDLPYRSEVPGVAHCCGHDAHTAMLLGAAKVLAGLKDQLKSRVKFIFQPAEETPHGGAYEIVKEGHLKDVDEIFGIHMNPQLPTGTLGTRIGALMASMNKIEIEVKGRGGHGAMPHLTVDPVVVSAQIVLALQTIVSRKVDPLDPAVVSVCQIAAGSAFNVIPPSVRMVGTCRMLSKALEASMPKMIEEISARTAEANGATATTEYYRGTPVLINHASQTRKMLSAFTHLGGATQDVQPTMGGEDFAFYVEAVPGAFAFLGAGDGTPATAQSFHHPRYNIDEKALALGAALFVEIALQRSRGRRS